MKTWTKCPICGEDDMPVENDILKCVNESCSAKVNMRKPHIIHVNRQHIAMNAKDGGNRPVYTIKRMDGKTRYAREIVINGPSRMVYNGTQLNCGARAWIETKAHLELVDEMSYQEAKDAVK